LSKSCGDPEFAKFNRILPRIHAVLRAFKELAHTNEAVPDYRPERSQDGSGEPLWIECGRLIAPGLRPIRSWVDALPVIIASATARRDHVRQFFDRLEHVAPPKPALPYQRVHQFTGAFGKGAFPDPQKPAIGPRSEARQAADRRLEAMQTEIRLRSLGKNDVLVITHQTIESAFAGIPHVRTLHHGKVVGDNDYRDCDLVIQIGGPFAPIDEIARQASAEAGRRVIVDQPKRTACTALMQDGSGVQLPRLAYADPAAQAVHRGIYDTSFEQGALGRGRGLDRGAADPLEVLVYGNVSLPVPVASIGRWPRPNRVERMILRGAVHSNAADIQRFYPDLFGLAAAAAQALYRYGGATAVFAEARRLARRSGIAHDALTWQPKGQGFHPRSSVIAHSGLAEFRGAVLRSFPEGLALWKVMPLTGKEDSDIAGKQYVFPAMSESSPTSTPPWTTRTRSQTVARGPPRPAP